MSHAIPLRRGVYGYRRGDVLVLLAVDSRGQWLEEVEVHAPMQYSGAVSRLYRALREHERPPTQLRVLRPHT